LIGRRRCSWRMASASRTCAVRHGIGSQKAVARGLPARRARAGEESALPSSGRRVSGIGAYRIATSDRHALIGPQPVLFAGARALLRSRGGLNALSARWVSARYAPGSRAGRFTRAAK
jgi:hypothetical protein